MNKLKQKILEKEKIIGTIVDLGDTCVSDIFSRVGYDYLWVDYEHAYLSLEQVMNHTAVAQANGTSVVVRVPQYDFTATKKVLEMGVHGIIFPMVKSAKEAKELIDFTLYPPEGTRGFGPMAANEYGLVDAKQYVKDANRDICRFVQIECKEIIDDLDELMENEYIDGYIFGPNDLSGSLGDFLNVYEGETAKVMADAIKKLKSKGKYVGIATGANQQAVVAHWSKMGADMLCAGCDYVFLLQGAKTLAEIMRKEMK